MTANLVLLDFFGHVRHHDRRTSISARAEGYAKTRNFVATAQCYGGTYQQFTVRLMREREYGMPLGPGRDRPG